MKKPFIRLLALLPAAAVLFSLVGCTGSEPAANNDSFDFAAKNPNLRSEPFTKAVFAGDFTEDWTTELCDSIGFYQNSPISAMNCTVNARKILAAKSNLVVIADGKNALLDGMSASAFEEKLCALATDVRNGSEKHTALWSAVSHR